MGGFCGAISSRDVVLDVYFGTDYHSHLGTRRGGMAAWDPELGFQREIHNIENAPFRTKFEKDLSDFHGCSGIGCISDTDPQPLLVRSLLGLYAITTVGIINNADALVNATEQTLQEVGDKAPADVKSAAEEAIAEAKQALEGSDMDAIKAATEELTQLFYAMSEKLYQQANPQGAQGAGPDMGGAQGGAQTGPDGQQYYDADYKVVDDDENKK